MKHRWAILGAFLLLIVSVALFVYLWTQMPMSLPLALLLWLLLFGIFALVGCIVWLAGWLPRKKKTEELMVSEPKPESVVVEAPKAEPSHLAEEEIKAKPIPLTAAEEVKTEPSQKPAEEIMDRGSKIRDIEGIGPAYAEKLNSINIYTTSDLLKAGATPIGRRELAEKTGISEKLILEWVDIADLFRIRGVGEEYADLLEEAGVDTVAELAKRVPEHLHVKMREVNEKKKIVRRLPTLNQVKQWIEEAKKLPRKVEY